jgi:hypothetical protein
VKPLIDKTSKQLSHTSSYVRLLSETLLLQSTEVGTSSLTEPLGPSNFCNQQNILSLIFQNTFLPHISQGSAFVVFSSGLPSMLPPV